MPPSDLELSLFRTLCWFSIFDIPLTTFDLWKWILKPSRPYDLLEVDQVIMQSEWLSHRVMMQDGMYFLKQDNPQEKFLGRHRRFLNATIKFRKLRRAAHFFQLFPGVRSVCAVNTLAWWHTTSQSDIDLFIVTSAKRIWSSRLFLVAPFLLTGSRPHHGQQTSVKDPFCFSFFCSETAMQFESLQWKEEDYYLAYWVKSIVPMFDRGEIVSQMERLNKWTDRLLPNARMRQIHPVHKPLRVRALPIQWTFFEPICRWFQRNRFPSVLKGLANRDSRVVINDDMLKFHENDRRGEFMQMFQDVYERNV